MPNNYRAPKKKKDYPKSQRESIAKLRGFIWLITGGINQDENKSCSVHYEPSGTLHGSL